MSADVRRDFDRSRQSDQNQRRGTTVVEMAFVLPIYLLVIFSLIEFGHAFMVHNVIETSVKRAARDGVAAGKTNSDITATAEQILGSVVNLASATIQIKDGSVVDDPMYDPESVDFDSLPDVQVENLGTREAFIVRTKIPLSAISIVGSDWGGYEITAQSVQRKE